jgi:hypothetical protein
MRQALIVASIVAVVVALAAISGSTIVTNAPKDQVAASAAAWVNVMDLMKQQKNLPEEAFDPH